MKRTQRLRRTAISGKSLPLTVLIGVRSLASLPGAAADPSGRNRQSPTKNISSRSAVTGSFSSTTKAKGRDGRSLRPFDTATVIESVKKTNRIVSVEEGWPFAGIGAEVAMQVIEHAFDWLDAPPVRVHGLDVPLPYAANLEKLALPQPEWVVDAVKKIV